MHFRFRISSLLILAVALFSACNLEKDKPKENINISIYRYDKLQNEYIEFNSFNAFQKMNTVYYDATKILVEDILGLGDMRDPMIGMKLRKYYLDSTLVRLDRDVEAAFQDVSSYERELSKGFSCLKNEIPSIKIPYIYTQLSALNESIVVGDTLIGISLDKYMGSEYDIYSRFYYSYQRRTMSKDRIAYDCLFYYINNIYPFNNDLEHNMGEVIIYYGISEYVVSHILGYTPQQMMGYNDEEMKWCKENEDYIWKYIVANNHLHSTDLMLIRKYIGNAPFTAFFGNGAPAKIGLWVGYRIVESYVEKNKVSIKQLLETKNYLEILKKSGYGK